jgi:hypothetical protein
LRLSRTIARFSDRAGAAIIILPILLTRGPPCGTLAAARRFLMHRVAVLLLSALLAGALLAAPAPFPQPSKAWVVGWDRPVDPVGDSRFERKGDELSIAVPGKARDPVLPTIEDGLEVLTPGNRLDTPRCLLRDVVGDFRMQVRVRGNFGPQTVTGKRTAGLMLAFWPEYITGLRTQSPAETGFAGMTLLNGLFHRQRAVFDVIWWHNWGPPLEAPAYLRLERRGGRVQMAVSVDGHEWTDMAANSELRAIRLPQKVKVGVVVESTAPGTFTAVFDNFKLTPLGATGAGR